MSAIIRNRRKLSSEDVAEIRARAAAGEALFPMRLEYGVSHRAIWYQVHQGKAPRGPFATALAAAFSARRQGLVTIAADHLRHAARILEESA